MTWRPPVRELDPLTTLLREAVRTQVFPGGPASARFTACPGESWRGATLPDGTPVRVRLTVSPATRTRRGPRACAGIRVTGELAAGIAAYRVAAEDLVDLATRAILSCEADLEPLGHVAGRG